MSATTLAEQGMAHVQSRNWAAAIPLLTKAIDQSKSPQWLLARSTAYMETGDLKRSLRDAEYAYCTAVERGNDKSRKQMIEAQHRRSVIFFRQHLYANADVCASWAQELAKGIAVKAANHAAKRIDEHGFYHMTMATLKEEGSADLKNAAAASPSSSGGDSTNKSNINAGTFARVSALLGGSDAKKHPYDKDYRREESWRSMVIPKLEALPADDPARKLTVQLVPSKPSLADDDDDAADAKGHDRELETAIKAARVAAAPAASSTNGPLKIQFYGNEATCTVTVQIKFASKEDAGKVQVDFQPHLITITGLPREPSTAYIVPHAAIDPAKCTFRAVPIKIELSLAKAHPAKWPSFGREELTKPDAPALTTESAATASPAIAPSDHGVPQPWSFKKTFDKMEDEEEEEADVQGFMKKLFKGDDKTDPEQRLKIQQAMTKSFVESNGTVLSTNHEEVMGKKVEIAPPDGVEVKSWN